MTMEYLLEWLAPLADRGHLRVSRPRVGSTVDGAPPHHLPPRPAHVPPPQRGAGGCGGVGGGVGEGVGWREGGGRGAGGAPPPTSHQVPPGLQGGGGPGVEGGGPGGGGPPRDRHPGGDQDPVEDVDEEETDHIVRPENKTGGKTEHHRD